MKGTQIGHSEEVEIYELLIGHRVVEVEKFDESVETSRYNKWAEGRMVLDNGTQIFVLPNAGCGGCSSGWYWLESLTKVDNIITRVEFAEEGDCESSNTYSIFVFADNER